MASRNPKAAIASLAVAAAAVLIGTGCGDDSSSESTPVPQPTAAQLKTSGLSKIPVAPDSQRIDLSSPPFSDPTNVTNPLFPISELHSAVLNGHIEGKPFHTETTLLPYTRAIEWPDGHQVETLVSQYAAFLDGRIQEVALDYYAQADDGSVWYFGEDVSDYNPQGLVAFTTDSWLAGRDGPPAMIMPGDPQLGDAFRTENIPGKVFEEVTVKTLDKTVPGPPGPVHGAMVGQELHDDGATSNKVFAPGYGEFFTKDTDGVEAMALAVPTDALPGGPPASLEDLLAGSKGAWDAIDSGNWSAASADQRKLTADWKRFRTNEQVPPRLVPPMNLAIADLSQGVKSRDPEGAATAAIDVGQAGLDLDLRYVPPAQVDLARAEQWTRKLTTDARAQNLARARGDLVTLQWIRGRIAEAVDPAVLTRIDTELLALQDGIDSKDFGALQAETVKLRRAVA
jgi:hypothetical protein